MKARQALVTGASSGIGRAFAEALARAGWAVTLVARNEAALRALAEALGQGAQPLVADLGTAEGVARVSDLLRRERFDLFINNAGIGAHGAFAEMPLEKLETVLQLNCQAAMALAHAFLSGARAGDALMNVSSTLGFGGFPYSAVYAATKAFMLSFSEALWYEQRPRGVYVMALCPGPTESAFHDVAGFPAANRPPRRIMQTPAEVVTTALRALEKRTAPSVISGFKNRAMLFVVGRLLGRRTAIKIMGGFGAPKGNPTDGRG